MKRALLIIAVLAICFGMMSCGSTSTSYLDRGGEIVDIVSEMVKNEDYAKAMLGNVGLYDEVLEKVKNVDFTKTAAVYELSFPEEDLLKELVARNGSIDNLSRPLKDKLISGIGSSIASHVNSKAGSGNVIVSSVFSASKVFVDKNIKENKYLLYVFEPGCSMLISLIPNEDGAVAATGMLILNEDLVCESADQVTSSFKTLGLDSITANKIK